MTLRQSQSQFVSAVALLIQYAEREGYDLTFAEAFRPPETAALYARQGRGVRDSAHANRLAIDLNLFRGGKYLTATPDHEPLGKYWESLGGIWGGRFKRGDGNHYEWPRKGVVR